MKELVVRIEGARGDEVVPLREAEDRDQRSGLDPRGGSRSHAAFSAAIGSRPPCGWWVVTGFRSGRGTFSSKSRRHASLLS
jgi:hypothetical protein